SGGQSNHTASLWAAIATLIALHARDSTGLGQFIDVSMHAAANVTTEQATQYWLIAGKVVQRQTGRHASHRPTEPVMARDVNGHEVHTGFPPKTERQLTTLLEWLDALGLRDEFSAAPFLEIAVAAGGIDLSKLHDDPMVQECYRAVREAMVFIASRLTAREFFVQAQDRGFPVGAVYAPEEVMTDPHIVARNFPTPVFDHRLGREVIYPGAPIRFTRSPWRISRPAPDRAQDQAILDTI
ncbi:MAG: CoA transferase, partial [Acidimicrobiia bacterium]